MCLPTPGIYTLSLHDALPIWLRPWQADSIVSRRGRRDVVRRAGQYGPHARQHARAWLASGIEDRKSTRLNSSHPSISYAVFCLKKKKNNEKRDANVYILTTRQ